MASVDININVNVHIERDYEKTLSIADEIRSKIMTKQERDERFPIGIYSNQWLDERGKQEIYYMKNKPSEIGMLVETNTFIHERLEPLIMGTSGAHTENGLDPGIQPWVVYLLRHGVETYESCEGGEGHSTEFPFIKLNDHQLWDAYSLLQKAGVPLRSIRYFWSIDERGFIIDGVRGLIELRRKANEYDYHFLTDG